MMSIKKGNRFSATYSNQTYEVVGKWNGNLVLAATGPDNDDETLTMLLSGRTFAIRDYF